jgi:hypothetical protein
MSIDPKTLKEMMKTRPTLEDCSAHFNCSPDSVQRFIKSLEGTTFREFRSKYMEPTKTALVNKALEMALLESNVPMLKFCLMNYCDWSDGKQKEQPDMGQIQIHITQEDLDL